MSKYKCQKCKKISTGEEWDSATFETYGVSSSVKEEDIYNHYFTCPECKKEIDGEYIEEINESIEVI